MSFCLILILITVMMLLIACNNNIEKDLEDINYLMGQKEYSVALIRLNELNNKVDSKNQRKQEIEKLLEQTNKLLNEQYYQKGKNELDKNDLLLAKSYFIKINKDSDLFGAAINKIKEIDIRLSEKYLSEAKTKYEQKDIRAAIELLEMTSKLSDIGNLEGEIKNSLKNYKGEVAVENAKLEFKKKDYDTAIKMLNEAISFDNEDAKKLLPEYKKAKGDNSLLKAKDEFKVNNFEIALNSLNDAISLGNKEASKLLSKYKKSYDSMKAAEAKQEESQKATSNNSGDSNTNNSDNSYSYSIEPNDDDKAFAWTAALQVVKENLKAPSTAKFPFSYYGQDIKEVAYNTFIVNSYVDAENSFGAKLRSNFMVKIKKTGENTFNVLDVQIY